MEVNHKELERAILIAYETKQPLFIEGTMGIGKSAVIKEVAKSIAKAKGMEFVDNGWEEGKFGLIDSRLSQYEPTDLRGVPVPDIKNQTTNWLKPKTMPRGNSCGIWFFDELNLANNSVQAAAYQIIRDRQIDDVKIPDGWLVISAGNGSEDKANIFEMPAPLCNRFTHLKLKKPSVDEWIDWAAPNGIHSDIISFLKFKGTYLHNFDPEKSQNAFGTPRTWEMSSNNLNVKMDITEQEEKMLIASCVGDGVAHEFIAFRKMKEKLNIDKIISEPEKFVSPKEVDTKYALAGGLASKYSSKPDSLKAILKILMKFEPEFTAITLKLCKSYRPTRIGTELLKLKEWDTLSKEYAKYIL